MDRPSAQPDTDIAWDVQHGDRGAAAVAANPG